MAITPFAGLRAIADECTLAQAVEFKAWHGNLPKEKHALLLEWGEGDE